MNPQTLPAPRRPLLASLVALLVLLRGPAAGAEATDPTWQLMLHSDRHSDALPLSALGGDDWTRLRPRPGRNLAYLDDELRLSRRQGDWTWSLLARSQATLVASDSALALAAQVDSGQRPAADRRWQADVRLRAFAGAGLALGRDLALAPGWSGRWEAQALALGRWRERRIDGPVQYSAATGTYSFDLRAEERDNRLDFPFRQPVAGRGAGLLLGAELAWDGTATWARAGLHDGGWLHWGGLPRQQAVLNTATQALDADGFLVYRPLVQGQNQQDSGTRWLPWRGTLAAGARLADGQRLGLQLQTLPGWGALPALQWQRPAAVPGSLGLGAEWRLHERRLTLALDWQGLALRIGADRLDAQARSRELALAYRRAF